MQTFSFKRDLTMIMKNSKQEFCRIWGRNALGKYSGVTLDTRGTALDDSTGERLLEDQQASLALPASSDDVEVVTIPDPSTYFPLPSSGETPEPPPVGAMFCDVYEVSDGRLEKGQQAGAVESAADLKGGLNGPGIEFFFPESVEKFRQTEWDLSVPAFRDPMTPTVPKQTIQALFGYGSSNVEQSSSNTTGSEEKPTLRSAI